MTAPGNSTSNRSGARVDPNFIGYRHICIVLVAPGFSAGERAAMAEAVAAEEAAFRRLGIGLASVESPTASRSDWARLYFAAAAGRDAEDTLVGVFSRGARGFSIDIHKGAHSRLGFEWGPGTGAGEAVARFLRVRRAFFEHPGRY